MLKRSRQQEDAAQRKTRKKVTEMQCNGICKHNNIIMDRNLQTEDRRHAEQNSRPTSDMKTKA